ncbi:MAG: hypothetical protein QHJ73_10710, partial [Armatimonadota bacterium]|nr:hypothetical protein [Armatimonadota bacterium]
MRACSCSLLALCLLLAVHALLAAPTHAAPRPPQFTWAQYGGGGWDFPHSIAHDSRGNVLYAGAILSAQKCTFGDITTPLPPGWGSIFVVKYQPDGTAEWVRVFGGSMCQEVGGLAVDAQDNIIVAGSYFRDMAFDEIHLTTPGGGSDSDAFLAKLDSTGRVVWARRAGGLSWDEGQGVSVDPDGFIYLCGEFSGDSDFGGVSLTSVGSRDVFLARYSPSGKPLWVKQDGGTNNDWACDAEADAHHGCFLASSLGLAYYDAAGNREWQRGVGVYFAPAWGLWNWGRLAVSPDRCCTVVGGVGAEAQSNIAVAKVNYKGDTLWHRSFGGDGLDWARGVAIDRSGNSVVAARLTGAADIGTGVLSPTGGQDML